ncbi:hypothetical protein [Mycobacterium sp. E735]|uniref:hypothetical protein n=1 Tax=Mycobacterium sp. E735 TaxID=1834148 RepID=UPI000B17A8A9|nr:hypothetical protein [Mycobacterium sp. E735]
MLIGLPDGGELEESMRAQIVPVGDHGVPSPVVYRHGGGEGQPALELTLEVWNGVPVCTSLSMTAKPDNNVHIRAKDIKLVATQLENSIEYWMSFLAYVREPAKPGRRGWKREHSPSARRAALGTVRTARREIRRKMTDDLLRNVASTYKAVTSARTEAVARAFNVSHRTAQRYIEKAREAGLL